MVKASFVRTNFSGGEWSQQAQGRMERDEYLTAMNLSYNGFATETAAWTRRSGSYNVGPTRHGAAASIYELHFNQINSYIMQFCINGHLRFATDGNPVFDDATALVVASATAANPCVVTTAAHGWSTGDSVVISYDSATAPNTGVALLTGRMYRITVLSATTFSLQDEVTGSNINASALSGATTSLRVRRVRDFATPYTSNYLNIRTVQDQNVCFILNPTVKPYAVDMEWDGSNITFSAADFQDGPYLDAVEDIYTITPSGTTGSVTLTATLLAAPANIFAATDVGRQMRILDEPDIWSAVTAYVVGNAVEYPTASGSYYTALKDNTNVPPDTDLTTWAVAVNGERWTWGTITAVGGSPTSDTCTFLIRGPDFQHSLPKYTYRMGLYSDTTGWPNAGAFHQGRFWLSGVMPNRLDASCPAIDNTNTLSFAPTNQFGTVADSNALSLSLKATDVAGVQWMVPSDRGLIVGTRGGEWLISASNLNDPITPTNVSANRATKFRTARVPAIEVPLATVFVQSQGREIIEYVPDGTEGGKFGGRDLATDAKHLTANGIKKLAYQNEPMPLIWCLSNAGELRSIVYHRESPWASQPPEYTAWSQHALGGFGVGTRSVQDMVSGPNPDGSADAITLVTRDEGATDPAVTNRVEVMNAPFEEGNAIYEARLLDHSRTPTLAEVILTGSDITGVRLHGLWYQEGQEVAVFFGGVNAGLYTVASGKIDITIPSANGLLTAAYLQEFASTATTVGSAGYGSALVIGASAGGAAPVTMTSVWQCVGEGNDNTRVSSNHGGVVDWANNRMIWLDYAGGYLVASSLVDGSFVAKSDPGGFSSSPWVCDDEFLYTGDITFGRYYKYNLSDLSYAGQFTLAGGLLGNENLGTTQASAGGPKVILACVNTGVSGAGTRIYAGNVDAGTSIGAVLDTANDGTTKFSNHRSPGVLYGINGPYGSRGVTTPMYLYKFTCAGTTVTPTLLKTILFTDLDASATSWGSFDGPVLDETDGNIILALQTNIGSWWAKYNATTGVLMWKIAATASAWEASAVSGAMHQGNRIQHGQLVMLGTRTFGQLYGPRQVINTIAGTVVNSNYYGFFPSYQCYNDTTGHLIARTEYVPDGTGGNAPDPAGYSANGWGSSSEKWAFLGPIQPPAGNYITPIVTGETYTSKGQLTRPILPGETGAQNGPRFGKTARIHQAAIMFDKTQDVSWGTSFNELTQIVFRQPGGTPYTELELFSGTFQDTIDDNYNIDASQLCWQCDGPFPLTVLAVGGFIETQDR